MPKKYYFCERCDLCGKNQGSANSAFSAVNLLGVNSAAKSQL